MNIGKSRKCHGSRKTPWWKMQKTISSDLVCTHWMTSFTGASNPRRCRHVIGGISSPSMMMICRIMVPLRQRDKTMWLIWRKVCLLSRAALWLRKMSTWTFGVIATMERVLRGKHVWSTGGDAGVMERLINGPFRRNMLDSCHYAVALPLHGPERLKASEVGTSYNEDARQIRPLKFVLPLWIARVKT